MKIPKMNELERLGIQQNFKQLVVISYLNRLAVLTGTEDAFLPMTRVTSVDDLDEHIIYDDREDFTIIGEDGTTFCPVITELMQDEEHGLNATCDADTKYGDKYITFRVVIPADEGEEPYVVCECQGLSMHIVIENGRWYAG